MKGKHYTWQFTFKCLYEEGDCKYKHPGNIHRCIGCYFAQVTDSKRLK